MAANLECADGSLCLPLLRCSIRTSSSPSFLTWREKPPTATPWPSLTSHAPMVRHKKISILQPSHQIPLNSATGRLSNDTAQCHPVQIRKREDQISLYNHSGKNVIQKGLLFCFLRGQRKITLLSPIHAKLKTGRGNDISVPLLIQILHSGAEKENESWLITTPKHVFLQ